MERVQHAALRGSMTGTISPSQAPKRGWCRAVLHALQAATRAVYRPPTAWAAAQGCLTSGGIQRSAKTATEVPCTCPVFSALAGPHRCAQAQGTRGDQRLRWTYR